ncbi:acyl carrier protein [Cereibacter sphaeroides]|nr:acyl carrier protein [Cereibacter sphaeroides]
MDAAVPVSLDRIRPLIEAAHPALAKAMTQGTRFRDHDVDSLDKLTLAIEAEQAFDITIEDAMIEDMQTVGQFAETIEACLRATRPSAESTH